MLDNLKKLLNEDQDPKAIEKITAKLENLLMSHEEVGYIAVQKKPAITVFPDSIVVTSKRIILCKPKNLGLSMEFVDYDWNDIAGTFVKEGILGSDFTFTTQSDLTHTVDYLPKNQARKLYTFAKEQLDALKNPGVMPTAAPVVETPKAETTPETVEETEAEEVHDFAEIIPVAQSGYRDEKQFPEAAAEQSLAELSQDALFEKLQNYKKLLDNGLILQGEYDRLKAEILKYL
ncbi:PH domain-containing protein [Flavobacterium sp.]|uniref:PH domain-containing protein n=1 Tax=Flavobacterium sp. TaxID=239 RepID=UPI003341C472